MMMPDAFLAVRFKTADEGGRKTHITDTVYGCPMIIDGEAFECRLFIDAIKIELGQWYELPVKFMNKDLVLPKLHPGKSVILWEGKDIGEGKIVRLGSL